MRDVRRAEERRGAGTSGCIVTSGTAARAIPGQGADVPCRGSGLELPETKEKVRETKPGRQNERQRDRKIEKDREGGIKIDYCRVRGCVCGIDAVFRTDTTYYNSMCRLF